MACIIGYTGAKSTSTSRASRHGLNLRCDSGATGASAYALISTTGARHRGSEAHSIKQACNDKLPAPRRDAYYAFTRSCQGLSTLSVRSFGKGVLRTPLPHARRRSPRASPRARTRVISIASRAFVVAPQLVSDLIISSFFSREIVLFPELLD